jgi:hypothetical protein
MGSEFAVPLYLSDSSSEEKTEIPSMFEKLPTSPIELKNCVLAEAIVGLKLNTFTDNVDRGRFNYDGTDRSGVFNVG